MPVIWRRIILRCIHCVCVYDGDGDGGVDAGMCVRIYALLDAMINIPCGNRCRKTETINAEVH